MQFYCILIGFDNRIIIYGGSTINNLLVTPGEALYALNLTNYEWYVPRVNVDGNPFPRKNHRANLVGKYMVVSFGK